MIIIIKFHYHKSKKPLKTTLSIKLTFKKTVNSINLNQFNKK